MGRPATGSPRWNATKEHWEARVSVAGYGRQPVAMRDENGVRTVPPCVRTRGTPARGCDCASCEQARRVAKLISDKARADGRVPASSGETANEWHARYLARHAELGKLVRDMRGAWSKRIAPFIGTTPIRGVRREHIVAIRDSLTKAVLAEEITAKRALNIWSDLVVAPMKRAFTDDDPRYADVRVGPAAANPTIGIKPPVTTEELNEDKRERQPLYPHEFAQVIRCAAVPCEARRLYVVATYLYCRPQEFYALRWSDVDWSAREVRIRRKLDVRTGVEKAGTKSDAGIREVPIHANLLPLLEAMHEERETDDARIVPLIGRARLFERFADQTRRHIKIAGVERGELFTGTPDLLPFDFRSWRTTGCTWLAMLGTDSYVIAMQAGHKSPDTTWASYIKRGPDLRQRHGEPFPPVPSELLEPAPGFGRVLVQRTETAPDARASWRRGRDSNPRSGFSPTPA
jgi:integrase